MKIPEQPPLVLLVNVCLFATLLSRRIFFIGNFCVSSLLLCKFQKVISVVKPFSHIEPLVEVQI